MADDLDLVPDVEQIVVQYLLGRDELTVDLANGPDERIWTEIAKGATFPALVVRRIGGAPVQPEPPLWHDRALLQLDAYGGTKKHAYLIIATAQALLAHAAFIGVHEIDGDPVGVVSGVEFGIGPRWLPDSDFSPAKPRYIVDIGVHSHAHPSTVS